jgi:hypothetical protein
MLQHRAPPAFVANAVTERQGGEGSSEPERDCDRPRQREPEARMRRPPCEENHRGQGGGRGQDCVLERTEAQDTRPCLTRIETG